MNRINMAPFNNLIPATNVPSLPFIFRSVEHMRKVMDGPIGDNLLKDFEKHDLIGLAFYDSGSRSFYNSKKAINTPADMKGMKIRVQQSDIPVALVSALGANATPMPSARSIRRSRPASSTAPRTTGRPMNDPAFRGLEILFADRALARRRCW